MRVTKVLGAGSIVIGLLMPIAAQAEPVLTDLTLMVGASQTIETPSDGHFEASQKGVIDIFEISPSHWQLTGVRAGFVLLNWIDEQGGVKFRWRIQVSRPGKGKVMPSGERICKGQALRCGEGLSFVSGVAENALIWFEALSLCRAQERCAFLLDLSVNARAEVLRYLGLSGREAEVELSANGVLRWKRHCGDSDHAKTVRKVWQEKIKVLAPGLFFETDCDGDARATYQIKNHVGLISEDVAKEYGLDAKKSSMIILPEFQTAFASRIKAADFSRKSQVIGEPVIIAAEGQEVEVHSGGEFKVDYLHTEEKSQTKEGWKRFGLQIKEKLTRVANQTMHIAVHMRLSTPFGSDFSSLSSHVLATEVDIPLGKRILIGTTKVNTDLSSDRSSFGMKNIPIIGPLFRLYDRNNGSSILTLWLEVSEL